MNLGGTAQGYIDYLNQSQARDMSAQQLADLKRKAELETLATKQDQAAQDAAGNAIPGMRGAIPPPPQAPMPGQASVPMQQPGSPPMAATGSGQMPAPPAGSRGGPGWQAPPRGNDAIMIVKEEFQNAKTDQDKQALTRELMRLGVPRETIMQWAQEAHAKQTGGQGILAPPGGAPPAPGGMPPGPQAAAPAPAGPPPYQTVPQEAPAAAPPPGMATPPQTAGAIPPPPGGAPAPAAAAGAPPGAAPPAAAGFTFDNVVERLEKQGLSGGDLFRAMNKLAPMMDANFKQQVQALNQQVAILKEQDRVRHENVMEGQGQQRADTGSRSADTRADQGNRRLDIQQQNADTAKARAAAAKTKADAVAAGNAAVKFDEADTKYWGDIMISGGTLPPGLARTPGGRELVTNVMKYAASSGVSPKAMMLNQAEFMGEKSAQRTLGTRSVNVDMAVNEADQLATLAQAASDDFKRTGYKKLNDVYEAVKAGTASPELRSFVAANTSFINAYARAISPSGQPTVSDKEHAREMLDTAFSAGDYSAVITQLKKEMQAAKKSPYQIKEERREQAGAGPASSTAFASEAEAQAAEKAGTLKKGSKVTIGGQSGTWQ